MFHSGVIIYRSKEIKIHFVLLVALKEQVIKIVVH